MKVEAFLIGFVLGFVLVVGAGLVVLALRLAAVGT